MTNYSRPFEPVQLLLTRLYGIYYTTCDSASAYNQIPLTEDTKKSFVVGGKQNMFERGFYGLYGNLNFFNRIMTINSGEIIAKKQAKTYIDDVIFQARTKEDMWNNLNSYFKCVRSSGLKAAPYKTKLFLRKVQFLGHIVSDKGLQPIAKKVQDFKNLKSPGNKRCDAHFRMFRLLQHVHRKSTCRLEAYLRTSAKRHSIQMDEIAREFVSRHKKYDQWRNYFSRTEPKVSSPHSCRLLKYWYWINPNPRFSFRETHRFLVGAS